MAAAHSLERPSRRVACGAAPQDGGAGGLGLAVARGACPENPPQAFEKARFRLDNGKRRDRRRGRTCLTRTNGFSFSPRRATGCATRSAAFARPTSPSAMARRRRSTRRPISSSRGSTFRSTRSIRSSTRNCCLRERQRLDALIEARATTRKPAAYLLHPRLHPGRAVLCRRARHRAAQLHRRTPDDGARRGQRADRRSRGGLRASSTFAPAAARSPFSPRASFPTRRSTPSTFPPGAIAVARRNVEEHGLADRVRLLTGDLFQPLKGERYDLILANPPYVDAEAVAAFPPEYAAEPRMAHAGGADGLDLVRRILADAPGHLTPDGVLICEVGRGRDRLDARLPRTCRSSGSTPRRAKARCFCCGRRTSPGRSGDRSRNG